MLGWLKVHHVTTDFTMLSLSYVLSTSHNLVSPGSFLDATGRQGRAWSDSTLHIIFISRTFPVGRLCLARISHSYVMRGVVACYIYIVKLVQGEILYMPEMCFSVGCKLAAFITQ